MNSASSTSASIAETGYSSTPTATQFSAASRLLSSAAVILSMISGAVGVRTLPSATDSMWTPGGLQVDFRSPCGV
jgi:hypothetical protein